MSGRPRERERRRRMADNIRRESNRRAGMFRIDRHALDSAPVAALSDQAFRALLHLWCFIAREGQEGAVSREDIDVGFFYRAGRDVRRMTPRVLAELVEKEALEEFVSEDGRPMVRAVGWLMLRPKDLTARERAQRYRRRLYAEAFYGQEDDHAEVRPGATPDELERRRAKFERLSEAGLDRHARAADAEPEPAAASEADVAALLALLGPVDESHIDLVRGYSARLPADVVAGVAEAVAALEGPQRVHTAVARLAGALHERGRLA